MKNIKAFAFLAAAGLALVSGCSNESTASSAGHKTYDEALQEYEAAKAELPLPDGYSWDAAPQLNRESDGQEVRFEDGVATMKVQSFWLCSWQQEWLAVRGSSPGRESAALDNLEKFQTLSTYRDSFDSSSRQIYDDQLAKAKLGDPSGVQSDVKANCA